MTELANIDEPEVSEIAESQPVQTHTPTVIEIDSDSVEPPRRRRGRPPKNRIEAESIAGGDTGTPDAAPKKRGPKTGGEKLAALGKQIQGLHMVAAIATGITELQLSPSEAEMLATSIANVSAQYGLELDGKTGAALQLFGAAAMIYTPRYFAYRNRVASRSDVPPTAH